jgi:hypothetical protein
MSGAFAQSLQYLLPQGYAWPRDAASVQMRVIQGLAETLQEHHDFVAGTVLRWQPHTTTRLAEWEEACGLPDACYGADQSESARLQSLLVRLRGVRILVDDGAPAAPAAVEQLCADMGALAVTGVHHPMRVGMPVGARVGINGRLHVRVLRNDSGLADAALLLRLSCVLERVIPARYELALAMYDQVFVDPAVLGWPGTRTNCFPSDRSLIINDPMTWDTAPASWDSWAAWSAVSGTIGYEHPVVDLGFTAWVLVTAPSAADGSLTVECRTGLTAGALGAWGPLPMAAVHARHVQVRWAVSGVAAALTNATIAIRY